MMQTSVLEVTRRTNAIGKIEQYTYKIIGKSPLIKISGDFIGDNMTQKRDLILGPYRLKFVDYEYHSDVATYALKSPLGHVLAFFYHATRWLDLIYRRTIITLAVWRLAEFHNGYIPSWRDIKILKRFAK
jgi:hypothetical protein